MPKRSGPLPVRKEAPEVKRFDKNHLNRSVTEQGGNTQTFGDVFRRKGENIAPLDMG